MEEIYNLGYDDNSFREMLSIYPNMVNLDNYDVKKKIDILAEIGCSHRQIRNIIGSNILYLDRSDADILKLINYLKVIGFNCLDVLFESNPYILNLDVYEIKNYIEYRVSNGEDINDIVDELDSNTHLFNDI